jgi:hypothetical protein
MTTATDKPYHERIQEHLLALKEGGTLPLAESEAGSGIWRFRARAAGWPIDIDLDTTVLEVRAYHGNDLVATGRVRAPIMKALVEPTDARAPGKDDLAPLRATVRHWKESNARIFMKSPDVARHPDGWNQA